MKSILYALCLCTLAISASAQNIVYDANAEVRNVNSFNKISISGALSVYLSQGNEQAVAISSEKGKYNDKIRTEVSNGTLKVYVENGSWNKWNWGNNELKAYITVTDMEALNVSGASSVKITDPMNVQNLKVNLTGASSIKGETLSGSDIDLHLTGASSLKLPLKGNYISFDLTGASTATVSGTTFGLKIGATGASNFRGYDLQSVNAKVDATGASNINVTVSKELEAEASGASNVGYKGDGVITKIEVTGSSTVKKKNG